MMTPEEIERRQQEMRDDLKAHRWLEWNYGTIEWSKVDHVKLRRQIEDRLRKDTTALRLTAVLLSFDLPKHREE